MPTVAGANLVARHGVTLGLCAILVIASVGVAQQPAPRANRPSPLDRYFIPLFGHGGPPAGLRFGTSIIFLNLSTTMSLAGVLTQDPHGEPIPLLGRGEQATASMTVPIPPGGTAEVVSNSNAPTVIQSGSAEIFVLNDKVVIQVEFSIFDGSQLQARAQIPGRQLTQAGSFPLGQTGRTGVALFNPRLTENSNLLQLATVDTSGRVITLRDLELAPGQQLSMFLEELFGTDAATPLGTEGATSAEFRASQPLAVLVIQQDGLVLTTQEVAPPRSVQTLFPDNGSSQ